MYVREALAAVLSKWCRHAVLLSKVTPRYVTLFTKGISRPFSCNTASGTLKSSGEISRLRFPFSELRTSVLTPRIHCSEAALQFAENTTFLFLCRVNTGIGREQSKMSSRCRGGIICI
jgi:hypothetical protein